MSELYVKHWVVTAWYPGGQGFIDEVVSRTEFTDEKEARAFMAEQKAENDSHHGWLCFRISERFVPAPKRKCDGCPWDDGLPHSACFGCDD